MEANVSRGPFGNTPFPEVRDSKHPRRNNAFQSQMFRTWLKFQPIAPEYVQTPKNLVIFQRISRRNLNIIWLGFVEFVWRGCCFSEVSMDRYEVSLQCCMARNSAVSRLLKRREGDEPTKTLWQFFAVILRTPAPCDVSRPEVIVSYYQGISSHERIA